MGVVIIVSDMGDVTVSFVFVVDVLMTSIGKKNVIRTGDVTSFIANSSISKTRVIVIQFDFIFEVVRDWNL
jgi:hypothetical protein